jgi:nucleoid DNA-binding protein
MTRRDLVKAISPNRNGAESSDWNPEELSRKEAREVIAVVFEAIAEALNRGETVGLPFATFEVTCGKRRKRIRFTPWFSLDEGGEATPPQTEPPPYVPSLCGRGTG